MVFISASSGGNINRSNSRGLPVGYCNRFPTEIEMNFIRIWLKAQGLGKYSGSVT